MAGGAGKGQVLNQRSLGEDTIYTLREAISKERLLFPRHRDRHLSARRLLLQREPQGEERTANPEQGDRGGGRDHWLALDTLRVGCPVPVT